jgi:predicted Zn-dependent protease
MSWERQLNAAMGYLNLGMCEDALDELQKLASADAERPEVIALKIAVFMRQRKWEEGLNKATLLMKALPAQPSSYLDAAFCLHEMGRTVEAKALLLEGPSALQQHSTYYYNLACYESCLGNLKVSCELLRRAVRMDDTFAKLAMEDPDLANLRKAGLLVVE